MSAPSFLAGIALAAASGAAAGGDASLPWGFAPSKPTGGKQHRKDRKRRKKAREAGRGR